MESGWDGDGGEQAVCGLSREENHRTANHSRPSANSRASTARANFSRPVRSRSMAEFRMELRVLVCGQLASQAERLQLGKEVHEQRLGGDFFPRLVTGDAHEQLRASRLETVAQPEA
jgi:hypothetical protein